MSEIMQFLEVIFKPLVLAFSVSNMFYMGLQVKMPEVIAQVKNKKTLALILVWGWVLGPALAYLIAWVLPLAKPYVIGLLLYSLAPCAPFVPLMVGKARGDVSFAAALIPIVAVATVVFMPLMGPLMIKGLAISTWALAKVLLIYILIPLALGAAFRRYAETVATKIIPAANVIAMITTVLITVEFAMLYGPEMIATAAVHEDVNVVGLSILSGAHMTLFPRVKKLLDDAGRSDVLLIGGGIIPDEDVAELEAQGIARLFGPGTPTPDIVAYIRTHVAKQSA